MPQQTERLGRKKEQRETFSKRRNPESRAFYQDKKWTKFRARVKKKQRSIDQQRVHDLYKQLKKTTFRAYTAWLKDEKKNPLCVDCLDEGFIRPGNVADHIIRIEAGGEPFDEDNISFRCATHHNRKSGKEAHE